MGNSQREISERRNLAQAKENAERKKNHDRKIDKFYDNLAADMEPIVHAQLRKEGQTKKFF